MPLIVFQGGLLIMPVEVLVCVYRQLRLKQNKMYPAAGVCECETHNVFLYSITQIVCVLHTQQAGLLLDGSSVGCCHRYPLLLVKVS